MNTHEEPQITKIIPLPDGYNPNMDGGRLVFELFLNWCFMPEDVAIRRTEQGQSVAIAYGGQEISI